jgi:hypothetical protein
MRKVWRYHIGNKKLYIEDGQTKMVKIMDKIHLMVDKTLHRKLKAQHELRRVSNTIQQS